VSDIQGIIGQSVESSDYTGEYGECSFDLVLSDGDTLRIRAAGRGEVWITAEIDGEYGVTECFGKVITAVYYEGSTESCVVNLEFEDSTELLCRAGGAGEIWINAEIL